jgi:uncharacterized protein
MTVSVNDDRITAEGEEAVAAEPVAASPIADPAPLGLAAFALTTFLLSAANAGWMTKASGDAWLGYAFAYGGLAQLLAGMWEFRNKNVFGSTAFGSYGAFWIGLGLWVKLVAPTIKDPAVASHDLGWILLAWAIFNTYMLLISATTNSAVFAVFLTLEVTEIILFIGNFAGSSGLIKAGGYIGIVTALVAWYTSAAGVANGLPGPLKLPVGRPLLS